MCHPSNLFIADPNKFLFYRIDQDSAMSSRLDGTPTSTPAAANAGGQDVSALSIRLREAEAELTESRLRVLSLQREVEAARSHAAEYKRMASGLEEGMQSANAALDAYRKETGERIRALEEKVGMVNEALSKAEAENESLNSAKMILKGMYRMCDFTDLSLSYQISFKLETDNKE
jgi:chromosome segregation ATPase